MMKCSSILFTAIGACLVAGCTTAPTTTANQANNQTMGRAPASGAQHLTGRAAEEFINEHFPDAAIPGPVEGTFEVHGWIQ